MTDWICTREEFGYEVDALINSKATEGEKGFMTCGDVFTDNIDEYEGWWTDDDVSEAKKMYGWEDDLLDALTPVKEFGRSKGYRNYDAPITRNASDIIANLMEYATPLESEIMFERTEITCGKREGKTVSPYTEFNKDAVVVKAVNYFVVKWKGERFFIEKDTVGDFEIDEADKYESPYDAEYSGVVEE